MLNIHIDPTAFADVIDHAVSTALHRQRDEQPADEAGRVLVDKRQAAAALSLSVATLDRITHPRGDLPCVKLSGRVLYRPETLDAWARGREEGGQSA